MDINFLPNQKTKQSSDKIVEKNEWSEPKNDLSSKAKGGFLFNGKPEGKIQNNQKSNFDIKKSRETVLKLIDQEKKAGLAENKPLKKNITANSSSGWKKGLFDFADKIKRAVSGGAVSFKKDLKKNMLADYQKSLDRRPINNNRVEEAKQKLAELPIIEPEKAPLNEKKETDIEEENIKFDSPEILETNLIKGEAVIFFNWKKNVTIFLSLSVGMVLFLGALYWGLIKWTDYVAIDNSELIARNEQLKEQINRSQADLAQVNILKKKLLLADSLLRSHIYWTNFFKFLEDNTLAGLHYMGFAGDISGKYQFATTAADYGYITAQINLFHSNENVINANVDKASISSGQNGAEEVGFQLGLDVNPKIFYK